MRRCTRPTPAYFGEQYADSLGAGAALGLGESLCRDKQEERFDERFW
jgi:hypothetical protein